jgi:parallel beta helix pectate lyase-like protein
MRRILTSWGVILAVAALGLFGCASSGSDRPTQPKVPSGANSPPCTVNAEVDSVPTVTAGVICLSGTLDSRLTITAGGTPDQPVTYAGGGDTTVQGIDVLASNVVVQGFTSTDAHSMGAKLLGDNIVFQDNKISHPVNAGDDTDGIRFFGDNIKMLNNQISDVSDGSDCNEDGCGDGPHPDCFQTYYSDEYPTSSNIVIDGNRCEKVAAQCLIAEGPNLPDDGVQGPGQSANWTFSNNYCDDGAAQALMIRDIQNVSITDNDFEGSNNKAIALADGSTGAHVDGNKLNPRIPKLITFDDDNEASGYSGPQPDED